MLAMFCLLNALCLQEGLAQLSASPLPDPASWDEMRGAEVAYDKENGLSGLIGVQETGAPLSVLPTSAVWLDVCRDVVGLRMDLGSPSRETITRAFERYRQSVLDRRRRTWQPQFEDVNALINEGSDGSMDDDRVRETVFAFTRECVRDSIATIEGECTALQQAIAEAGAPDTDSRLIAAAHQQLWRTRAVEYLQNPGPIPIPPQVLANVREDIEGVPVKPEAGDALRARIAEYELERDSALRELLEAIARAFSNAKDPVGRLRPMSTVADRLVEIDERMIAAIAPLLDDPEGIWHRSVMVSRHPHARPVIDAWHGLTRVGKSAETPALATLIADAASGMHAQFDAMRTATRQGWRAQIVFGATPQHPGHAEYRSTMRNLAMTAQLIAVALMADLARAAIETKASEARTLSIEVREATASLTGDVGDGRFTPAPLGPDWPPRVTDGARMQMLAMNRE